MEGGSLTDDSEGKINLRGWDVEGSVDGCLRRGLLGNLERGSFYRELRDSGTRALEMEHVSLQELC